MPGSTHGSSTSTATQGRKALGERAMASGTVSATRSPVEDLVLAPRREGRGVARWGATLWQFARRKPLGALGGLLLVLLVVLALGADWIAPYDPLAVDPVHKLQGPSRAHPFGTDNLGRDML